MAHKIQIAAKARLPIITCTTRDVCNIQSVLETLLPKKLVQPFDNPQAPLTPQALYWTIGTAIPANVDGADFRKKFINNKASLLIINPDPTHSDDMSVSVGVLPIPQKLIEGVLSPITKDDAMTKAAAAALGGVTVKEAYELSLYSMAEHAKLDAAGLAASRNELFKPQKGLYPVETKQDFYEPTEQLSQWVEAEKEFFLYADDPKMIPRGLMLAGIPGTGKSEAAKYIARKFEVPLYRLDLATTQDKWVGNSAKFLQANLDVLDQQEPCVVLIDEVEKVLGGYNEFMAEMLSMLLWWMQTHKSKVLTICTTNDLTKLPKEFYRPGRLDEVMTIPGLTPAQLPGFINNILKLYGQGGNEILATKIKAGLIDKHGGNLLPAATVETEVKKAVKKAAKGKVEEKTTPKKFVLKSK